RLEELHARRERLEAKIQNARELETMRFQELDDAGRRFQSMKDAADEAQEKLAKTVESFSNAETIRMLLGTEANAEELPLSPSEDDALTTTLVEQFAASLSGYRRVIDTLDRNLTDLADQLQGELDELQLLTGGKIREVSEARALYEQKLAEPEAI